MRTDIIEKIPEIREKLITEKKSIAALAKEYSVSAPTLQKYLGIEPKKRNIKNTWQDLIGKQFANRIVLERDYNPPFKSHETGLRVKCLDCERIYTIRKSDVEKSCPYCAEVITGRGHKLTSIGDRFGYLEVISSDYDYSGASPKLLCRCICGTEKWIALKHLKGQGHSRTISCGCASKSAGEIEVETLLDAYTIPYEEQYFFEDFSKFSAFDFALFNEDGSLLGLIEYDGEQHFRPVEVWGGEEKFILQKERDARKDAYCAEKGIRLLRIPYTDFNKISLEYLFQKFPELRKYQIDPKISSSEI